MSGAAQNVAKAGGKAGPRFGPAGRAESFTALGYKQMTQVPEYLAGFGLTAFEYQAGHGVKLAQATGPAFIEGGREYGFTTSIHAPYYISMASAEEEKRNNSLRYLLQSAGAVRSLGGRRVIFHPGGLGKQARALAVERCMETLARARRLLDDEGYEDICLCPETMGKESQLGALDEVLLYCGGDKRHIPCLDMGHLNAVTQGGLAAGYDAYAAVHDKLVAAFGQDDFRTREFHVHFSKIEYTGAGEKRHLTFEDRQFGPDFEPFMQLCRDRALAPTIICESAGTQTEDAKAMMEYYNGL